MHELLAQFYPSSHFDQHWLIAFECIVTKFHVISFI